MKRNIKGEREEVNHEGGEESDEEEFDPEDYEQRCMYKEKGGEKHCNANARALFETANSKNEQVKKLNNKFKDYDELKAKVANMGNMSVKELQDA